MYSLLDQLILVPNEILNHVQQQLALYQHRIRSRRALAKLNDNQLADVGLSRETARKESNQAFWKGDGASYLLIKERKKVQKGGGVPIKRPF